MVCPAIPSNPIIRKQLEEDLAKIGCLGLIQRPWNLRSDEMVQELIIGVLNQYELTVRGQSATWNEDIWTDVYEFKKTRSGLAFQIDKYANGKFLNPVNTKERYAISDCRNDRHRRVLEFLISILYSEKCTRVTVTVANTIFGALEDRVVH